MTTQLPDIAGQLARNGVITAQDIQTLRRSVWADGEIDASEADAIFTLNDLITTPIPEWSVFFIEALSSWLVDQEQPRGYIDERQAAWLTNRIGRAGTKPSRDELELVVHCLETARSAPPSLNQFALTRIEAAVLDKPDNIAPHISAESVQLLRRLIFASGSQHPGSVGQAEAEMLWRLKEKTLGAVNAPEWNDLFVQGVGNYLQGFSGPAPLSPEREAELEYFINRPAAGLGHFFRRMAETRPSAMESELEKVAKPETWFGRKWRSQRIPQGCVVNYSANKPLVFDPDAAKKKAQAIRAVEQGWLDRHIQADNEVDPLERQLLRALKAF